MNKEKLNKEKFLEEYRKKKNLIDSEGIISHMVFCPKDHRSVDFEKIPEVECWSCPKFANGDCDPLDRTIFGVLI